MGPTGERLATIEANTAHIKEQMGELKTSVQGIDAKLDRRLKRQETLVERHSIYFQIIGWVLGVATAVLIAWLSGLGELIIRQTMAAITGSP